MKPPANSDVGEGGRRRGLVQKAVKLGGVVGFLEEKGVILGDTKESDENKENVLAGCDGVRA